jgi:hypothetical protein
VRDKHSVSDPGAGEMVHKKSGPLLLPTVGMKLHAGHGADHAELWTDIGRPPTAGSSESLQ